MRAVNHLREMSPLYEMHLQGDRPENGSVGGSLTVSYLMSSLTAREPLL